jgi:hypothetical protein
VPDSDNIDWHGDERVPEQFRMEMMNLFDTVQEFASDPGADLDQDSIDQFYGSPAAIMRDAHATWLMVEFRRYLWTAMGLSSLNNSFRTWRKILEEMA